jgi:hypothetical protein
MSNVKGRVAKLEGQVGPIPSPPPPPLTDEERAEAIRALLAQAEAEPDNEELQRRAGLIRSLIRVTQERHEQLTSALGVDPDTDPEELEALGVALVIESHSHPDDLDLAQRRRAVQIPFDQLGFRYWDTPAWETFKASAAGVEYEERRAADIAGRLGRPVAVSPVDDVGEIETLPASPGPSAPPETPSAPPETPSPEPSPVPPSRKPSIVSESGLRPCKWVTGPWR